MLGDDEPRPHRHTVHPPLCIQITLPLYPKGKRILFLTLLSPTGPALPSSCWGSCTQVLIPMCLPSAPQTAAAMPIMRLGT